MSSDLVALLYLVAGTLFILALRGLSSPETSRRGNYLGIAGMAIAVVTTLFLAKPGWGSFGLIILGIAIGGAIGAFLPRRIPLAAIPPPAPASLSSGGAGAVRRAGTAPSAPGAVGTGAPGQTPGEGLVEMSRAAAMGAIPSPASVIPSLNLEGRLSGKPIILPYRHYVN